MDTVSKQNCRDSSNSNLTVPSLNIKKYIIISLKIIDEEYKKCNKTMHSSDMEARNLTSCHYNSALTVKYVGGHS
jgi:hypothetical protein